MDSSDKYFAFRFLSGVHGQEDSTLDQSRIYMWSMLEIDSAANLDGMFLPQNSLRLFESIKEGFRKDDRSVLTEDIGVLLGSKRKQEKSEEKSEKRSDGKWLWYTLGGAGVVAGATAAELPLYGRLLGAEDSVLSVAHVRR